MNYTMSFNLLSFYISVIMSQMTCIKISTNLFAMSDFVYGRLEYVSVTDKVTITPPHHKCTLLAKKLCDSSFLCQNLDLIHSQFKTESYVFYILAGYQMVCWPSLLEFW